MTDREPSLDAAREPSLNAFRSIVGFIWVIVTTLIEGAVLIVTCIFSRKASHAISRMWARHLLEMFGVRLRLRGAGNLDPTARYVFVSNHQSHLDIPILISITRHFLTFMAKKELFFVPMFGWCLAAQGHISIDRRSPRKARESFDRAVQRLKSEEISLVIFPEGTRTRTGEIGDFKRGSFALAIESGLSILPIAIDGSFRVGPKGKLLVRSGTVTVSFGTPIATAGLTDNDREELAGRVRAAVVALKTPQSQPPQDRP